MSDAQGGVATSVEAILAATRHVIAERGTERFTMSAIAVAAGVSRPTLYRWFSSKDALLESLTAYEEQRFEEELQNAIEAQHTPCRRLDAALRCLVTYLDDLLGPDQVGADTEFAIASLAAALEPHTESFARLVGAAMDEVPAVSLGYVTPEQASELFMRMAYSHYLVPHAEPEVLLATLGRFVGLDPCSVTNAS